jgi:hypothetical protein
LVEFNGEVYSTDCPICTEKSDPETEWWVLAVKGSMQGWILINNQNVKLLDREF